VGRRTNTSWSSSQSATLSHGGIAKVEGDEIGRTRQASTPNLYRLHPRSSEPERHPPQQFPGRRVLPLVELADRGAVVVQGVSRRQLSGVAYGLSYQ